MFQGDYRVEVHFLDGIVVRDEPRQPQDGLLEGGNVTRRLPADPAEEGIGTDRLDHPHRVAIRQGRQSEGDVLQVFDVDPAEPEEEQRTVDPVARARIAAAPSRSTGNVRSVPSSRFRYCPWRYIAARERAALSGNRYEGTPWLTSSTKPGLSSDRPRKLHNTGLSWAFAVCHTARATSTSSTRTGGT